MKVEEKELFAVAIIFLLSLGIGFYPVKQTLPDFSQAMLLQSFAAGKTVPLHIAAAGYLEQAYSPLQLALSPSSPQAIVSFLLFFPPLLFALSSLFLYLALRQLELRRAPSAFAAILLPLSLSSLYLLPGVYGSAQLALLFFSVFLLAFFSWSAKSSLPALAFSFIFAALAAYASPAFGAAGALAALSFAAAEYRNANKARLAAFAAIMAISAAAAFLSPDKGPLYSIQNLALLFTLSPFLLAAASCAAVLYFYSAASARAALSLPAALLASLFSPLAGSALLLLPAAEGAQGSTSKEHTAKQAKLLCAYAIAFFAVMGLALQGADAPRAIGMALLVSTMAPLALHFYGDKGQQFFTTAFLCLALLSLFTLLFYSGFAKGQLYPQYADKDLSDALLSLSGSGVSQISMLSGQDAASFYLPGSQAGNSTQLSRYLLSGKAAPASGSHILLSAAYLDEGLLSGGFEIYRYKANMSSGSAPFALFVSQEGRLLLRELDSAGGFSLKDASLVTSSGQPYATVPLSRTLLLMPGKPISDPANRLVVLEEGADLPYFMKIYSGQADELLKLGEFQKVSVYKVN